MKLLFTYIIIASIILFNVKYFVAEKETYNKKLIEKIEENNEEIRLLKADWAYLNNPHRIAELASNRLNMGPLQQHQFEDKEKYLCSEKN